MSYILWKYEDIWISKNNFKNCLHSMKRIVSGITLKWTFRVKSTCTSFHQNGLYLQAMIGSLPLALFEIVSYVLQPFSSCFSFNPLFSRTLSTSRPKWSRPASTAIGGNHVVIANDLLSSLIACTIVSWIT